MKPYVNQTRQGYDQVADEYARRIFHELEHKPWERAFLDRFARRVQGLGPVCDIGCGPGHVIHYLHQQGVQGLGIDLSPRMVELARELSPDIEFRQGDMTALAVEDETWGGIIAWYSLIHIPREDIAEVLREFWRVLRPGGLLSLAFHRGQEIRHLDEWWGKAVSLDFRFFETAEMEAAVRNAGFTLKETFERPPYEEEVPTQRVYLLAQK